MSDMSRRQVLNVGSGIVGSAIASGLLSQGACANSNLQATTAPGSANSGNQSAGYGGPPPASGHPHLFNLEATSPLQFTGGTLRGASEESFPILTGQNGSVYTVHLEVNGVREPHWHPSAWELTYIISGEAKWTILGPQANNDPFVAKKGDLVFIPQGHFHYFENNSQREELHVLVVFNTSGIEPRDDIGIVASLSVMPPDVLAAVFGTPVDTFARLPRKVAPVVIGKKK